MYTALPLDIMTIEDKLRAMDDLWEDLCRNSAQIQSPVWHHDVLCEREQSIREGGAVFEEWSAAKQKIRDTPRISCC